MKGRGGKGSIYLKRFSELGGSNQWSRRLPLFTYSLLYWVHFILTDSTDKLDNQLFFNVVISIPFEGRRKLFVVFSGSGEFSFTR